MNNEDALNAYIGTIIQIREKLAALTALADDHMGHAPEEINWSHVGSANHILEELCEIAAFAGIKEGGAA